jgi:hypothetical protein
LNGSGDLFAQKALEAALEAWLTTILTKSA